MPAIITDTQKPSAAELFIYWYWTDSIREKYIDADLIGIVTICSGTFYFESFLDKITQGVVTTRISDYPLKTECDWGLRMVGKSLHPQTAGGERGRGRGWIIAGRFGVAAPLAALCLGSKALNEIQTTTERQCTGGGWRQGRSLSCLAMWTESLVWGTVQYL